MSSSRTDHMKVDPNQLTEAELRVQFAVLRERLSRTEEDLKRLNKKPLGKTFLRMVVSIVVSLLMLLSGLLYTYAINKLTSVPPDNGAQIILQLSILIYVISLILQIINAGGS